MTLTSISAKFYNALIRNRIELEIEKILGKNLNGFRRKRSTTSDSNNPLNHRRSTCKKSLDSTIVCRFLQGI